MIRKYTVFPCKKDGLRGECHLKGDVFGRICLITRGWEFNLPRLVAMGAISTTLIAVLSWMFAIDGDVRARLRHKLASRLPVRGL